MLVFEALGSGFFDAWLVVLLFRAAFYSRDGVALVVAFAGIVFFFPKLEGGYVCEANSGFCAIWLSGLSFFCILSAKRETGGGIF